MCENLFFILVMFSLFVFCTWSLIKYIAYKLSYEMAMGKYRARQAIVKEQMRKHDFFKKL